MNRAAKTVDFDIDALSVDVTERFDAVDWKRFNAPDMAKRTETRSEVLTIRNDLMKVAAVEPTRAAQIWNEHVPSYVPRPPELAGNEEPAFNAIEPGRRRRRTNAEPYLEASQAIKPESAKADGPEGPESDTKTAQGTKSSRPAAADLESEAPRNARARLLMEGLNKQYVMANDKYHFRDKSGEVAFEAQEKKLVTQHETPAVVTSMIDLAEARGWSSLKLTGTKEFRREAWLQASLRDFEVSGYQPDKLDKARLDELRTERSRPEPANSISEKPVPRGPDQKPRGFTSLDDPASHEPRLALTDKQDMFLRVLETTMRHRGDSPQAIAQAHELATERIRGDRVHVGKLMEVGTAPYQDKLGERPSHFMTLEDDKGRQSKVWGVDLPRALGESGAEVGEVVAVAFRGRQPVTVDVPVKDHAGKTLRTEKREVDRNAWEVVPFDKLREEAKAAAIKAHNRLDEPSGLKVFDRTAPSGAPKREVTVGKSPDKERSI